MDLVRYAPRMVYARFGRLKHGIDFDHFGLKQEAFFFTLAWCLVFCLQGTIFFCINIGTFVALLKCLGK